jgi:hypothetical protein
MPYVHLSCPKVALCEITLFVADDAIETAIASLSGEVARRDGHVDVDLRDPADVVIAMYQVASRVTARLSVCVISAEAGDLVAEDAEPIRSAWSWISRRLRQRVNPREGCVIINVGAPSVFKVPDAIAQRRPGVVLWCSYGSGQTIVHVDREGFVIGRFEECDFAFESRELAPRHVRFESAPWKARAIEPFYVEGARVRDAAVLEHGMLLQIASLTFVVLAIQ